MTRSRLQWVSALRQAAAVSGGAEGFQRRARAGRRGAGARREQEVRETRARLQHEVRARLAAEAQAQVTNLFQSQIRSVMNTRCVIQII